MLFLKRSRVDINMKIVDLIVKEYFTYLKRLNCELNCSEISELLRHSMCRLLNLESNGYSKRISELSKGVCNALRPLILEHKLTNYSDDYRKGILESCVHCMEMAKSKVLS